jgi:gas vesicle protein
MIKYEYYKLFQNDSVDKQLILEFEDGVTVTNEDIFQESLTLDESLCSEEALTFGCCEASKMKIKIANIVSPRKGLWATLSIVVDGHVDKPLAIGRYKVDEDKLTADRLWRELTCYDCMYDVINTDVADWYNKLLPNPDSTVTLKQFRDSFFEYLVITQEETSLVNDDMVVRQTIQPSELSGKDVVFAICQINGCFGHISRKGIFKYIHLEQDIEGLYPSDSLFPSDDLFPREPKSTRLAEDGDYISATYEDYVCHSITKLQIRQEENDIGAIVGDGDNAYIIQDNFLVYGMGAEELETVATNVLGRIMRCTYRPFTAEIQGNPCLEVGDAVRLTTKYELIESYIMQATLKGIQALRNTFEATGDEVYSESVNSVNTSIVQLKGKTNILTRTVEETKSRIEDVNTTLNNDLSTTRTELSSEITQTASELSSKISKTEETLQANINGVSDDLTTTKTELSSEIKQTESSLSSTITSTKTELQGNIDNVSNDLATTTETLSSQISQTAEEISAEVTRATGAEGELSSSIKQNADNINLKVNADGIISAINISKENVTIDASKINLNGDTMINAINGATGTISLKSNRFELESDNLTISKEGKIEVKGNGIIKGCTITGSTLRSENSAGTYVEISGGYVRGGSNNGESGWLEFGGDLSGDPCLNIRADNLVIGCSKIAVADSKTSTSAVTGETTQDIKYTIDMDFELSNNDGVIKLDVTKTQKALKFRKGIFIGQRNL